MQIATKSQQSTTQRDAKNKDRYCKVERSANVESTWRCGSGKEWYSLSDKGVLKRFSHYRNRCGQRLYKDGKPWGAWKEVEQDKIVFYYSGEKGLGLYTADGECLRTLDKKPSSKSLVTRDIVDAGGKRAYHARSATLYLDDGSHREANVVVGPPPGKQNFDVPPKARGAQPSYDDDSQPSPSDRPYVPESRGDDEEYIPSASDRVVPEKKQGVTPVLESQFESSRQSVIVGEYRDRCGRLHYKVKSNQKVWHRSSTSNTSVAGAPSIRISKQELQQAKKEGKYRIVENEHGTFRVKDGEVERQAVVGHKHWTTGHRECRRVPVRRRFGRVCYVRKSVWVEKSHTAANLGWVKDPAVGLEREEEKNKADKRKQITPSPTKIDGADPFAQPGARVDPRRTGLPFAPSKDLEIAASGERAKDPGSLEKISLGVQPRANKDVVIPESSKIALEREHIPEKDAVLPDAQSAAASRVVPTQPKNVALPKNVAPIELQDVIEPEGSNQSPEQIVETPKLSLPPLQAIAKGEEQQDKGERSAGPAIEELPLEHSKPSLSDSPQGSRDALRLQPWTPPNKPQLEREKLAKRELQEAEIEELQLDAIQLPQAPKLMQPSQMEAVLTLVARLEQIEFFEQAASKVLEHCPTRNGHTQLQTHCIRLIADASYNQYAYDRLLAQSVQDMARVATDTPEHTWLSELSDSIDAAHTHVLTVQDAIDRFGRLSEADSQALFGAISSNRHAVEGQLERIFNESVDVNALLEWAESSEYHRESYRDVLQRLEGFRARGTWEMPGEQRPQPLIRPQPQQGSGSLELT